MERIKVTDEWLYKYMPIVDLAIIQKLGTETETDYRFSRKFERKMKRLIKWEKHLGIRMAQNIMKRVAIFFIGLIGAVLLFTMSVEAYREKFFETIRTFFKDCVVYKYYSEEKEISLQSSEPSYLPDGYQELERIENDIALIIIYENCIGEQIVWEQKLVIDGGNMTLDSEYDYQEIREIDGSTATVFLYSDGYAMAYYESEDYVYYITADNLEGQELFQMIDSMVN